MADLNPAPRPAPQFDRVARFYRAMEYLSFGPMLERCRFAHIPELAQARRALVLGDGDGRFLAHLMAANREIHAYAVDASSAMLDLLRARIAKAGAQQRLTTQRADARVFTPQPGAYDLVVTHFFLDCLTLAETERLIARIRPHLAPGAAWLVSEFQIPPGNRARAALSRGIISALYAGFRLLTGLRVRKIPPWREELARSGFAPRATRTFLSGLLVSEVWQLQTTAPRAPHSHKEVTTSSEFAAAPGLSAGSIPGIDPGPLPSPDPEPDPAPGPPPDPDPEPYPGPMPVPQPVTRS